MQRETFLYEVFRKPVRQSLPHVRLNLRDSSVGSLALFNSPHRGSRVRNGEDVEDIRLYLGGDIGIGHKTLGGELAYRWRLWLGLLGYRRIDILRDCIHLEEGMVEAVISDFEVTYVGA